MRGDQVTFFGVGDGWPCRDRNHSSTLYRLSGTALLVDCGEPISRSYAASRLSYDLIDRVLISHMHGDHVGGFQMFIQSLWLKGRSRALKIHLPREGIAPLRKMLKTGYLFDELLKFKLGFTALAAGRKLKAETVNITAHPTRHLLRLRSAFHRQHRQPFEAFAFVLETSNVRIVHSADIEGPVDLEPLMNVPVNLLVCELAHFKPVEIFRFLRGRAVRQVAFTHLSDTLWRQRAKLLSQAKKALPGIKVCIPIDGERLNL